MKFLKTAALPLCASILLAGCGGSSSSTPAPTASMKLSTSQFDIGSDTNIALTSNGSQAKNGQLTAYAWSVASAPQFSQAQPADKQAKETTFVPDVPGAYNLCLTVTDEKKTSDPNCATLNTTNSVPLALLSKEAIILVDQQYQLDGSRSLAPTDGEAHLLTYQWTIEQAPNNSNATLDDPTHKTPRFNADTEGEYQLSLVVNYEQMDSAKAFTRILVNKTNALPIADAGDNIDTWILGEKVTLDGSNSYDPDGDALQFRWGFGSGPVHPSTGLPQGSQAVLEDTNTPTPSFVPDMIGSYDIWMQVFDGTSISAAVIKVNVDQLPAGHINTKPVAVISEGWGQTFEVELGQTVNFTATYSYDKETLPYQIHNIGKRWKLLRHPKGFDAKKNVKTGEWGTPEAPSFGVTFTTEGQYDIQLEVFDGELWSDPHVRTFTALTGANRPPIAKAALTGVGAVSVGQKVTLDGEGSSDPDSNRLSYQWSMIHKPDGSQAKLSSTTSAFPTFIADAAGGYLFELTVTDSHGFSSRPSRLQVFAKARNNAPVARPSMRYKHYNEEQPLAIYSVPDIDTSKWESMPDMNEAYRNSLHLLSDAYDPDGDELSYLWSLLDVTDQHKFAWATNGNPGSTGSGNCNNGYLINPQGPYTTAAELYDAVTAVRDWTCTDLNLAPISPATYRIQLLVSDGIDTAGPYEFNVPAVLRENYPTLLLEKTAVTAANTQSMGEIEHYAQQQIFPYTYNQVGSFPVFDSYLSPNERYTNTTYTLTAFDRDYTISNLQEISEGISKDYGYFISFEGLTDGQVIPKGKSVKFSLILHTSAEVKAYQGSGMLQNMGEGLTWSFSIKEKPEWTFKHTPFIYPARRS